ncbi:hypothetical protein [Clostridium estertheticum]|uniref:hypothetical protein n=1 Tax=Clostridium estertheticum TaxID=238834 RepID=UPI001C0CC2C2|nr:hypothetical protein [Clostridium estertheticum]MBU3076174.1 hypothetical protein [Clostridium estertheticum]MBU3166274.1 hypothetical protein [Clostridium estertheticum]
MAYIGNIATKEELQVATNKVLSQLKSTIVKLDLKEATTLLYWIDAWSSKYLKA